MLEPGVSIKVGVVGASGYAGQELVALLLRHPRAELVAVTSRQYAGQRVAKVFPRFEGRTDLLFSEPDPDQLSGQVQAVFLALPHKAAAEIAAAFHARGVVVYDLSADFRLHSRALYEATYQTEHPAPELLAEAVYGLPERYRADLRAAQLVACPGCYPTSVILAAAPALASGIVEPAPILINSLSGVSGAGRKAVETSLFCECNESVRAYGRPFHRHLPEMEQELSAACGLEVRASFTPHLVPVNRGIVTNVQMPLRVSVSEAKARLPEVYAEAYAREPFVRWLGMGGMPDTKLVVGTNLCEVGVHVDERVGMVWAGSAIDNLVKGASGQALQAFNIRFGFVETEGLPLL